MRDPVERVDAIVRELLAERRRRLREFLAAVRLAQITDRLVERKRGYDPDGYRAWLAECGERT